MPRIQSIDEGLIKLSAIVPLERRQRVLPPEWRALHRAVLRAFVDLGRPPRRAELASWFPGLDVAAALRQLDSADLMVVDGAGEIAGAYPFSTEATPHRVTVNGREVRAMCAFDAIAVAPMYGLDTRVDSVCAVSGAPVRIVQSGRSIVSAEPPAPWVGIHWRETCGHTAHSLCREMIFVRDEAAAATWQGDAPDSHSLYPLRDAVEFAARFFLPLVADRAAP